MLLAEVVEPVDVEPGFEFGEKVEVDGGRVWTEEVRVVVVVVVVDIVGRG